MKRLLAAVAAATLSVAGVAFAADTRTYTDASGVTSEIPIDPQRIISLHDHSVTLPLVELGANVAGSHGRVRDDGSAYLRSVNTVLSVDFDNSDIEFVGGFNATDFEKITAIKPDVIIGRAPWDEEQRAKLEIIAPVVLVDGNANALEMYRQIADVAGRSDVYDYRLAAYNRLIEQGKEWLENKSYSYSVLLAWDGQLKVFATYGGLTRVLDDLGFQITETGQALRDKGVSWGEKVSAELLPEQDADFIFDTYRIDGNDGPAKAFARMGEVLPTYCDVVSACAKGNYVLIPREIAAPVSFTTLTSTVHLVVSHVAGRRVPN